MRKNKYWYYFIAFMSISLLLVACKEDEAVKTKEMDSAFNGVIYQTKVDPESSFYVGDLEKEPWGINISPETFDSLVDLKVDMLSQEAAQSYKKDGFELLTSPISMSVEGRDNLRLNQPVLTTVKIPEAYQDHPIEEMFFGYFTDNNWLLYPPDQIDLENHTLSIYLHHFSTYGMLIPTEDKQLETYAKTMANRAWQADQGNQDYLSNHQDQYHDLFMTLGVQSKQARNQLIADVLSYVDPSDTGFVDLIAQSANSASKGKAGNLELENKYKEYLGKAIYHAISKDPSSFAAKANIFGNLSSAAGALAGGDSKESLKAIANMLNTAVPVSQLANATSAYIAQKSKEVIDYWTQSEIDKAYEIYTTGKGGRYGYGDVLKGDFEGIFTVLGGLDRQLNINVVNKYCEKNGISPDNITEQKRQEIIAEAKAALKKNFDHRLEADAFLKEKEQEEKDFIKVLKDQGLLSPTSYTKYFDIDKRGTNYNVNHRLDRLYNIKNMVLKMLDEETRKSISDESLARAINQWIVWTEAGQQEKFYEYMKEVGLLKEMVFEDTYAWVFEKTITFPYAEALAEKNKKSQGNYTYSMNVGGTSAEFSYTYTGPEDPYNWQKKGFSQAGKVSWTEPSPLILMPDDEVSLTLTSEHTSRSHDNYAGIGIVAANFFKIDDKNEPYGPVTSLSDKDGKTSYTSSVANGYAKQSGTFTGQLGSGAKVNDRIAIQVSASGGAADFATKIWYVYQWKAQ